MKEKKYLVQIIAFIGLIAIAGSCLDTNECNEEVYSSPKPFVMKLVDENGINLISNEHYHPDSIALYYKDNLGIKLVQTFFQSSIDGYLLQSTELPYTILETDNDLYYLYLNASETDTLNVYVIKDTDGCNIWHYYSEYLYNEIEMNQEQVTNIFTAVKH